MEKGKVSVDNSDALTPTSAAAHRLYLLVLCFSIFSRLAFVLRRTRVTNQGNRLEASHMSIRIRLEHDNSQETKERTEGRKRKKSPNTTFYPRKYTFLCLSVQVR